MAEPVTLKRPKLMYAEPICEHIALAEFDIDEGSIVKHQHPYPIGIPASQLGELMLPEGVHARSRDFCMFTVPRVSHPVVISGSTVPSVPKGTRDTSVPPTLRKGDLLCLNLVSTRLDKNIRRGALVRALAIVSPYYFLDAFKRVMVRIMEIITDTPVHLHGEVLCRAFAALNNMDLSAFVKPSPIFSAYLFTRSEYPVQVGDPTRSELKNHQTDSVDPAFQPDSPLSGSVGNTVASTAAANVASGTSLPLSLLATREVSLSMDWTGILDIERAYASLSEKKEGTASSTTDAETPALPAQPQAPIIEKFHVPIPLVLAPNEILGGSITSLLKCFKQGTMVIYNAIITNRRVLFLGHQLPVAQVVHMVLSACLLVSVPQALLDVSTAESTQPFCTYTGSRATRREKILSRMKKERLKRMLERQALGCISGDAPSSEMETPTSVGALNLDLMRKCYPYTSLTDLSFLDNPLGYIAGVANPLFAQRESWWDVLCDISTGEVKISPSYVEYERGVARIASNALAEVDQAYGAAHEGSAGARLSEQPLSRPYSNSNSNSSPSNQARPQLPPSHPISPEHAQIDNLSADASGSFASSVLNAISQSLSPRPEGEDTKFEETVIGKSEGSGPSLSSSPAAVNASPFGNWGEGIPVSSAKLLALAFHYRRTLTSFTLSNHDSSFITQILHGLNSGFGEQFFRDAFRELTTQLIEVVRGTATFPNEQARASFLGPNAKRIYGLIRGASLVKEADQAEIEYALRHVEQGKHIDLDDSFDEEPVNLLLGDAAESPDEVDTLASKPIVRRPKSQLVAAVSEVDLMRAASPTTELVAFVTATAQSSQQVPIPVPGELRALKRALNQLKSMAPLEPMAYTAHLRTLLVLLQQEQKSISEKASTTSSTQSDQTVTSALVHYLLALLPPYSGGLDCIGRLLLHANHEVKQAAFEFLVILSRSGAEGNHAVFAGGMNRLYVEVLRRYLLRGAAIVRRSIQEQLKPMNSDAAQSLIHVMEQSADASVQMAQRE